MQYFEDISQFIIKEEDSEKVSNGNRIDFGEKCKEINFKKDSRLRTGEKLIEYVQKNLCENTERTLSRKKPTTLPPTASSVPNVSFKLHEPDEKQFHSCHIGKYQT